MITNQISIFIENRRGRLAEVTNLLATNNIDIRALSIADTTNFGILRIIVDDPISVEKLLKENGLTVSITSVLSVCVKDEPGGLNGVLQILAANDIAVEYMYAFNSKFADDALVVMRIEEEEKAQALLKSQGYTGRKK